MTVMTAIVIGALTACAPKESPAQSSEDPGNLALLQQYSYLTATFYGVMTFNISGTVFTFPSELAIPSVPITWMGPIFNGKLEQVGPGKDVTIEVHGSASDDGTWLDTVYYSQRIVQTLTKTGNFYRVTLRNVPIAKLVDGVATELGTFQKEGSDLQKHVEKIEFADGPLSGGQITPTTIYVSTDWKDATAGQKPALKLTFEKIPSQAMGTAQPIQPGMGMGQR